MMILVVNTMYGTTFMEHGMGSMAFMEKSYCG